MKIAIVGHSKCGKDATAEHLVKISRLTYSFSTSTVIAPYAAAILGLSVEEAFARRHECRDLWRHIGDDLRVVDPAYLARRTLARGDLCVGIRSEREMLAVIRERLCDEVWWLDRDVPDDPTMEFDSSLATLTISNTGTLAALHRTLGRMARERGIWRG